MIRMKGLSDRQTKILYAIIHEYIKDRKPISSKRILEITNLDCSSATIRNEMNFLEKNGYIYQPHTSAGRIPSDVGYRFYVECLKSIGKNVNPSHNEMSLLTDVHLGKFDDVLKNVGVFLSHWMKGMAVIEKPFIEKLRIKRITISNVLFNYWIVVLVTNMGIAESFTVLMDQDVPVEDLEKFLSEKLYGIRLEEVKSHIEGMHLPNFSWYSSELESVISFMDKILHQNIEKRFFKSGFESLMKDESLSSDSLRKCATFMEDEEKIKSFLDEHGFSSVPMVNIGHENDIEELENFAIFFSGYSAGDNDMGKIAVFTSKTTDYYSNIKSIEFACNRLTEYMTKLTNMVQ